MNPSSSSTIEEVLFERMGMSVEDAVATGTDLVDEKVASAVESGIDVDARMAGLGQLLEKLSEPATVSAITQLVESLPQLAKLAALAEQMPNVMAAIGDVADDYQKRCESNGVDVEKALTNGLQAALFLGSQVDGEHLRRIGDLLGSDILNPNALNVVDNAARSLNAAQQDVCGSSSERIGMFGLIKALRDPQIQRSLAFAVQFGKCFGKNIDSQNS